MKHIRLYEDYSDEELRSLRSFGHEYGVIKRRVESSDLEINPPFDAKAELDFIEDWVGPAGERAIEVSGFIEDDATELDISLEGTGNAPLKYNHIRLDAKSPLSPHKQGRWILALFPAGLGYGETFDVSDEFPNEFLGNHPTYLQAVIELYLKYSKR